MLTPRTCAELPRGGQRSLTGAEQCRVLEALVQKGTAWRLLELLEHGWGHLDIIVAEYTILKSHMTKTDI